jgi:hypothetical protein
MVVGGNSWGLVYKDTTANQAYLVDSLPCHTHPLQGYVEVLASPTLPLASTFCLIKIFILARRDLAGLLRKALMLAFATAICQRNEALATNIG